MQGWHSSQAVSGRQPQMDHAVQGWKEQEDGTSPWSRVLPEEGADMQEEDEAELERAERFEHQYNFRFEARHGLPHAACCLLVLDEHSSRAGVHVMWHDVCQFNGASLGIPASHSSPRAAGCWGCQPAHHSVTAILTATLHAAQPDWLVAACAVCRSKARTGWRCTPGCHSLCRSLGRISHTRISNTRLRSINDWA